MIEMRKIELTVKGLFGMMECNHKGMEWTA